MSTVTAGKHGEDLAKQFLLDKGYVFITANFHCHFGEIDLIFQDRKTLVFVEVKTRWSHEYGSPAEAITKSKLKSFIKSAAFFSTIHPKFSQNTRLDAILIDLTSASPQIEHLVSITS